MNAKNLIGSHHISSLQDLNALAIQLTQELRSGDVVLLQGDLGAGKTTFAQFLGAALGVEDAMTSPTYTIVAEYQVKNNSKIHKFIHLDLYRSNLDTNYVQEILHTAKEQKAVVVIEWPEAIKKIGEISGWVLSIIPGASKEERVIEIKTI
ncbi:MAG TPA: tRNA (adenosine(37)-N6)-threonylcarbamoyltransferase complex ATPase subunit type 1 TsaE [Candidatus Andersenbacteria bacterium]|nr:tRNA (adenosine(37)-N6)-threonylcarbamoyltransferase complex ATPase subunit type 1 TsaE [Candidatus Andersenbacteria bacterium]